MSNLRSSVVRPVVNPFSSVPSNPVIPPEDLYTQLTADWPDLAALVESVGSPGYKHIHLYTNYKAKFEITLNAQAFKMITSDGVTYDTLGEVEHIWDAQQDIGSSYRWVIIYRDWAGGPVSDSDAIGWCCSSEVCSKVTTWYYHFSGWNNLRTIIPVDTSLITDFSYAFADCYCLKTIPEIDTSGSTDFHYMFYYCKIMTTIPLIDTANGTNFSGMFYQTSALAAIPLLNTEIGTNFYRMFYCSISLITVPKLNTQQATLVQEMFRGCINLDRVPDFSISGVYDFSGLFWDCANLKCGPSLSLSSGNNFYNMFYECLTLSDLDTTDPTAYAFDKNIHFNGAPIYLETMLIIFNRLLAVASGTITISTYTNTRLTDEQRLLATHKGWTISILD